MKKNKFLSFLLNKWTLIIAGVLIIAIAGTVTALNWNNWFGTEEEETGTKGNVSSGVFWNVDYLTYTYYYEGINNDRRTRDKDDNYYHVMFCDLSNQGRCMYRRVKSDAVMTKIDMYSLVQLVTDDKGIVIDVIPTEETGYYLMNVNAYVTEDQVEGQPLKMNTSDFFMGLDFELTIPETVPIYDLSGTTDLGTRVTDPLYQDDLLYLIAKKGSDVPSYVLLADRTILPEYYLNVNRMYDTAYKMSTRKPNADGFYEIELAHGDGIIDTFLCTDIEIVNKIDAQEYGVCWVDYDPETMIISEFRYLNNVTKGKNVASFENVQSIENNEVYSKFTASPTSRYWGKNNTSPMAKKCKVVIDYKEDGVRFGSYTDLRVGDRIQGYTNVRGELVYIFVIGGRGVNADEIFWLHNRKYNTTTKTWTRKPEADGRYVFKVTSTKRPGRIEEFWTRDPEIAEYIDKTFSLGFAANVSGNQITKAFPMYKTTGAITDFVSWFDVIAVNGKEITFADYRDASKTYKLNLADNASVYNVNSLLSPTNVRVGDKLYTIPNTAGELEKVFVRQRGSQPVKTSYCPHCNQNVTWYSFGGGTSNIDGRHLILLDDLRTAGFNAMAAGISTNSYATYTPCETVLDLAGHTLEGTTRGIVVYRHSSLYVMDSVGGGRITARSGDVGELGHGILALSGAKVTLAGGTVDMEGFPANGNRGPAIYVDGGAQLDMYDGATIKGAIGRYSTYYNSNGELKPASGGLGGSVDLIGNYTGTDAKSGEKVPVKGAVFNMYGGTVTGGQALGDTNGLGGNIYSQAGSTINMSGGTITGGYAQGKGGNVYLAGTMNLSGSSKITGSGSLYVSSSGKLNVGDLASDSSIVVEKEGGGVFASGLADPEKTKNNFKTVSSDYVIKTGTDTLSLSYVGHPHCVCGGTVNKGDHTAHESIYYEPLDQAFIKANGNKLPASGNYFLTEDVNVKSQATENGDLNICYNGHKIFINSNGSDANRAWLIGYLYDTHTKTTVNFCDCVGGGGITKTDSTSRALGALMFIYSRREITVNFFGGTYDASGIATNNYGGLLYVGYKKQNDYSGTIRGDINIYDGATFIGSATATAGNIIMVDNSANHLNIMGGNFTLPANAQVASGGIVANTDNFTISGAPVVKGNGASIFVNVGRRLIVGELEDGADICVSATGGVFTKGGAAYKDKFTAASGGEITTLGDDLAFLFNGHVHCACGQAIDGAKDIYSHISHNPVSFQPLTQALVTALGNKLPDSGDFFLAEDITVSSQSSNKGNINLCYNGHTIKFNSVVDGNNKPKDGQRVFLLGQTAKADLVVPNSEVTVNFCDCQGGGGITRTGIAATAGNVLCLNGVHKLTLNVFGGVYDGSGLDNTTSHGGMLRLTGNTTNIYGGKFIGAKNAKGGNIFALSYNPSLNIYDGTFENAEGTTSVDENAAGIDITADATVTLYNSVKINGENGVNIRVAGNKLLKIDPSFNGEAAVFVPTPARFAEVTGGNDAASYKDRIIATTMEGSEYVANGSYLEFMYSGHVHAKSGKDAADDSEKVYYQPVTQASINASGGTLPKNGSYFLAEDVVVKEQVFNNGDIDLCFNGHTVTINTDKNEGGRILLLGHTKPESMAVAGTTAVEVNICDCQGNGGMIKTDLNCRSDGAMMRINANHKVTLNIYDGTFDASGIHGDTTGKAKTGGILYVGGPAAGVDPSVVNIMGGHFIGADIYDKSGGCLAVDSMKVQLNISGGIIEGGKGGKGGNIYCIGQLNMTGGTIKDGIAKMPGDASLASGGNIFMNLYGNMNITGGSITGGVANLGGNIAVLGTNATSISIKDTTVTGGSALPLENELDTNGDGGFGDNIYMEALPINISGDIVFDGIESGTVDIYVATSNAKINASDLGDDVKVSVATGYTGVFAPGAAAIADKFPSTEITTVTVSGEDLATAGAAHVHCVCGQTVEGAFNKADHTTHTEVTFEPLTQALVNSTFGGMLPKSGNYFLYENIKLTRQTEQNDDLNLCFNGHTVTITANGGSAERFYMLGYTTTKPTTVNFCNCKKTGGVAKTDATCKGIGALMFIYPKNDVTVNIFGGTFDASGIKTTGDTGGIAISWPPKDATGKATVNVYGGKFIGAMHSGKTYGNIIHHYGETLNIYGGEFESPSGSDTAHGITSSKNIKISGVVTITGANGGDLYLTYGAKLDVGTLDEGSEIFVSADYEGVFAENAAQYLDYFVTDSAHKIEAVGNDLSIKKVS